MLKILKPWRICARAILMLSLLLPAVAGSSALDPQDAARIMPVSQVRAGMEGYGLTVFRGDTIEQFAVKVLGVLPNANAGSPLILVRIGGGELNRRPINVAEGMSGSPVYVNGKLIGAVAYAGAFAMEPLGLLTPIEDMLQAWDPSLPGAPPGVEPPTPLPLPIPLEVGGETLTTVGISTDLNTLPATSEGCAWFRPLLGSITTSGFSAKNLARLNAELAGFSTVARQGPGRMDGRPSGELKPGSAVGFSLVTGDVDMTAIGTVTYRRGDRILAFGHPFMQFGPIEMPMSTAWVHDIFTSYMSSFKLASPVSVIGASTQDLPFSVSGELGLNADMLPMEIKVSGDNVPQTFNFRANVLRHPLITPLLVQLVASEAIMRPRPYPGQAMASVTTRVKPEGLPEVTRTNLYYSEVDVGGAALEDLQTILTLLQNNRFEPVQLERVSMDVQVYNTLQTATIERIHLDRTEFEPGETVEVDVQVRPYRGEPEQKTVTVTIPENALDGRAVLMVQGGSSSSLLGPVLALPEAAVMSRPGEVEDIRNAASVQQMLERYQKLPRNNELIAQVILPSGSFVVEGERLKGLPPVMEEALQSPKSSGTRLARDQVKGSLETGWFVRGGQMLALNIRRRNLLEKAAARPSVPPQVIKVESLESDEDSEDLEDESEDSPFPSLTALSTGAARVTVTEEEVSSSASERDSTNNSSDTSEDAKDKPGKPSGEEAKDLGRNTRTWLQTTKDDFAKGRGQGIAVTSSGSLAPGMTFRRLADLPGQFVWAVSPYEGGAVAGGGSDGTVWSIKADGNREKLFETEGSQVAAVVNDGKTVWAGTSPDGRVWSYSGGSARQVAKLPTAHVAALVPDGEGGVYAAAGDSGLIWRVNSDGSFRRVADTGASHVQTLYLTSGGTLLAGTGSQAAVWNVMPGNTEAVFKASEDYVSSIVQAPDGSIYASTGPRGKTWRIRPGAAPVAVVDRLNHPYAPLLVDGDDVLVCDGQQIHRVRPNRTLLTSQHEKPLEVFAAAPDTDGGLYLGTVNSGAIWKAEPSREAVYESAIHDAGRPAAWGIVRMHPAPEGVQLQVRTGTTETPGQGWSGWVDIAPGQSITRQGDRYVQYRLQTSNSAPANGSLVEQVQISYLPANQPPTVKFSKPVAGDAVRASAQIRWTGSDPDKDRLAYELSYSSDGGQTWKSLETETSDAADDSDESESSDQDGEAADPGDNNEAHDQPEAEDDAENGEDEGGVDQDTLEQLQAELERHPDLPQQVKETIMAAAPDVVENARSNSNDNGSSSSTNNTTYTWNTRKVSDGEYWLKITASDAPANGIDALEDEAILGPVIVSNTEPSIMIWAASPDWDVQNKTLEISGVATTSVAPVAMVQYRLGGRGEWFAAQPLDGVYDETDETFVIRARDVQPKDITKLEVRVQDTAGNTAMESKDIKGPQ